MKEKKYSIRELKKFNNTYNQMIDFLKNTISEENKSEIPITKRMKSVFVLFYTDLRLDLKNEMSQKKIDTIFNKLDTEEIDVTKYISNISIC